MKIQRLGGLNNTEGALYVFADVHAHLGWRPLDEQVKFALAGPFPSSWQAQEWITAQYMKRIADGPPRELFDECWLACGGTDANPWLLYAIISAITRGLPVEQVRRRCGRWHLKPA